MKRLTAQKLNGALCVATIIGALGTLGTMESRGQDGAPPQPAGPAKPAKPPEISKFPPPVKGEHWEISDDHSVEFSGGSHKSSASLSASSPPHRRPTIIAQSKRGPEVQMRLNEIIVDGKRASQPLIVRSSPFDSRKVETLKEDLAVMTRILDKAVKNHGESFYAKAAGIDILALSSGARPARTLYVEDYGVIFTINVAMPLKGGPKTEAVEENEPARNEEWEEAKSELYGKKRREGRAQGPYKEYNESDVNDLREGLVAALKNASNIRDLKPTDWITLVVRGMDSAGLETARFAFHPEMLAAGNEPGEESNMILRVRKSALDEATSNEDAPDLQKIVSVTIY